MVQKKAMVVKVKQSGARPVPRKMSIEKPNAAYLETGHALNGAEESQMFGKPCFKINGKAFMSLFDGCVVFKLNGNAHRGAMELQGSKAFDPSGKGRPMKEWVQVTMKNKAMFPQLASEALKYVKSITK